MNCQVIVYLLKYIQEVKAMIRLCLDKALDKYKISRYELAKRTGIQYQIIDNYYKNKVMRYDSYVLERICLALDCGIGDILEFVKE